MIDILATGLQAATETGVTMTPMVELGRGAIAGALIVGAAFMAGYAAIRRGSIAACALLVVLAAAALELSWLGFFPALSPEFTTLIQAAFAAAAIVFLSATVGAARYNALVGGVLFTAALVIAGMGLLNFLDRVELSGLMRIAMFAVGGFAAVLTVTQAVRGDAGARLILPGVALAASAPFFGPLAGLGAEGFSLAPHALFTLGVLAASLVALTESAPPGAFTGLAPTQRFESSSAGGYDLPRQHRHHAKSDDLDLSGQLARVLDYAGVAVWDWSHDCVDQTGSLARLLGADSNAPFTPDAMLNFIHADDAARFEAEVLAPVDGPFDVALKLFDGRKIRLRGARAAHEVAGELERLVAFIELVGPIGAPAGIDQRNVQNATAAAIVPAATGPTSAKLIEALDNGEITAAFQPIVSLDNNKIVGYEALARWPGQTEIPAEGPEIFVKRAEATGRGDQLARAMLDQAAAFLSEKLKADKRAKLFVAMNVSWGQISAPDFDKVVRAAIDKYELPKDALVLELTEGDAICDGDRAASGIFKALKEAGAALAFDDFGAGFSCLSNLRKYDFDYLKIDKSFTGDLEENGDGGKIVRALASLGSDLGLKVIAEGVETKRAAKAAASAGCGFGQGYGLGEPLMNARAPRWTKKPAAGDAKKDKAGAKNAGEKAKSGQSKSASYEVDESKLTTHNKTYKNADTNSNDDNEDALDNRLSKGEEASVATLAATTRADDGDTDEETRPTGWKFFRSAGHR